MANCNFKIAFTKSPEELLGVAKKAIESHKGTFKGDFDSGHFTIPIGIGDINGTYTVADSKISIDITKKPLLVTCKMIENRLRGYLSPK
jgi:hypothetical protein